MIFYYKDGFSQINKVFRRVLINKEFYDINYVSRAITT